MPSDMHVSSFTVNLCHHSLPSRYFPLNMASQCCDGDDDALSWDVLMKIIITRLMVLFHEKLLNFLLERSEIFSPLPAKRCN